MFLSSTENLNPSLIDTDYRKETKHLSFPMSPETPSVQQTSLLICKQAEKTASAAWPHSSYIHAASNLPQGYEFVRFKN